MKVFACSEHGECTHGKRADGIHLCDHAKPIEKPTPEAIPHSLPVFMTAAPRDRETQERAIASVREAGMGPLTILCEPGTEIIGYADATVFHHGEKQGQFRNLIAALRAGIASGSPYFITMEDDVVLHRQTGELLSRSVWPDNAGCVQLYTAARLAGRYRRGVRSKLRKQDSFDMLGCCALLFSREAATVLVEWADTKGWRGACSHVIEEPSEKKAGDTFIGEVLSFSGLDIWIHNPSLAEHIGEVSTLGHHKESSTSKASRTTLNFPGQDADLFSIFTARNNMKIAAIYKTFDGGEFVDASLASIYENVDSIVMVHSNTSWLGERGNTVRERALRWCNEHDDAGKVHHIDVELTNQEAQYAAGIEYLGRHKIPCDVVMAIDADEVWEDRYIERARQQMTDNPSIAYRSNMHTYLKNPFFRVDPPFGEPTIFLRDPRWLIKSPRGCHAPSRVFDNVWMHHYTYVRETREAVERKLHQSCQADKNETVVQDWMASVYDRLPEGKNLHGFVRWREVWNHVNKVWWCDLPPAMRDAELLKLWVPEGHLLRGEQDAIYRLTKGRKQAVDLGTYRGLSATILALACERVHTVDCYDGSGFADTMNPDRYRDELTGHSLENTLQFAARYGNITAEQSHTANAGQHWERGPVDVLFVDADHSEQGTLGNLFAWMPHMTVGGLVLMHDDNDIHPGVQAAVAWIDRSERLKRISCGEWSGSLAAFEVVR